MLQAFVVVLIFGDQVLKRWGTIGLLWQVLGNCHSKGTCGRPDYGTVETTLRQGSEIQRKCQTKYTVDRLNRQPACLRIQLSPGNFEAAEP
jgi:hypothetical protein